MAAGVVLLAFILSVCSPISGWTPRSQAVHHHNYYGAVHNYHQTTPWHSPRGSPREWERDALKGKEDRIYYFQVYLANLIAHAYLNDDGGIQGFFPDLVLEVCRRAGKECYWIHDTFTNCWRTDESGHEYPGQGLLAGWVDACVGFLPSASRRNSFNFTQPYSNPIQAALRFRAETGVTTDLSGLRIGFVTGWAFNPTCLANNADLSGNHQGDYEAVFYRDEQSLSDALNSGQVDAVFKYHGLQNVPKDEQLLYGKPSGCGTGYSIMARYGDDVISWWNEAFQTMYDSGEFHTFCAHERKLHGTHGNINCLGD